MSGVQQISVLSYMTETGLCSLIVCVLPVLYSFYTGATTTKDSWVSTRQLHERGSTYLNPIEYRNLTVRAVRPSTFDSFFQDGIDVDDDKTLKDLLVVSSIVFNLSIVLRFVGAVFMFQPSKVGLAFTTTYAMLLSAVGSVIYYHIMVENYEDGAQANTLSQQAILACLSVISCPLIRVIARSFSTKEKKGNACK